MSTTSQRGIGVVEVILIVAIIIAIGVLGYVFISQTSKDTQPENSQSQTNRQTEPGTPDVKAAANIVKASYDAYRDGAANNDIDAGASVFASNATSEVQAKMKNPTGVDPVLCAQNVPTSIEYSAPSIVGGDVMVMLTTKFVSGGDGMIHVTVDGVTNKISDISCQGVH